MSAIPSLANALSSNLGAFGRPATLVRRRIGGFDVAKGTVGRDVILSVPVTMTRTTGQIVTNVSSSAREEMVDGTLRVADLGSTVPAVDDVVIFADDGVERRIVKVEEAAHRLAYHVSTARSL